MPSSEDFPTPAPPAPDREIAELTEGIEMGREIAHLASTQESKRVLFALINALAPFAPKRIITGDGKVVTALVSTEVTGATSFTPGFTGTAITAGVGGNRVEFSPSFVTGLSSSPLIPEIGGVAINDPSNTPYLELPTNSIASIRIEWNPDTVEVSTGPSVYDFDGFGSLVGGAVSIVASQADERPPQINTSTGTVTTTGISHVPLGSVINGSFVNYFFGPMDVDFCYDRIRVSAPSILHVGDLVSF